MTVEGLDKLDQYYNKYYEERKTLGQEARILQDIYSFNYPVRDSRNTQLLRDLQTKGLIEYFPNRPLKFRHVISLKTLPSILEGGLDPSFTGSGWMARDIEKLGVEKGPKGIYLSPMREPDPRLQEVASTGEALKESLGGVKFLEVEIPGEACLEYDEGFPGFAVRYTKKIPPRYLKVLPPDKPGIEEVPEDRIPKYLRSRKMKE